MNKELKIIIAGNSGSGKSTMMYQLENLLLDNGYDVEISLENSLDFKNKSDFYGKMGVYEEERLKFLKENTKITLTEIQTNGHLKENKPYKPFDEDVIQSC